MISFKGLISLEAINSCIDLYHYNKTFKMTYNYISDSEICLDFSLNSKEVNYQINYDLRLGSLGLLPFCTIKGNSEVHMVNFKNEDYLYNTGTSSELYDLVSLTFSKLRSEVIRIVTSEDKNMLSV